MECPNSRILTSSSFSYFRRKSFLIVIHLIICHHNNYQFWSDKPSFVSGFSFLPLCFALLLFIFLTYLITSILLSDEVFSISQGVECWDRIETSTAKGLVSCSDNHFKIDFKYTFVQSKLVCVHLYSQNWFYVYFYFQKWC